MNTPEPNCFTLETWFPKKLLFTEIAFVDDSSKTSVNLMHKYGVRFFKCNQVLYKDDLPNVRIVICDIFNPEKEKWRRIMKDLLIMCPGKEYRDTCDFLYETFKNYIKEQ